MSPDLGSMFLKGMLNGLSLTLKALWPLWLFILLVGSGKLLWKLYEIRRLAGSGMNNIDRMDGRTFEKYLEIVFRKRGYKVERTKYIGDYGADMVLSGNGEKIVVQAKRYRGKVGVKAVQEVVAAKGYYGCDKAMVVTNSFYTHQAKKLARANNVELWDRNDLVRELLAANAKELFDGRQRSAVLKREKDEGLDVVFNGSSQKNKGVCVICGKVVSEKVKAYCLAHSERFGGQIYCYEHQKRR